MPVGYLITVGVVAVAMLLALAPLRRSGGLGTLSWLLSAVVNESPFVAMLLAARRHAARVRPGRPPRGCRVAGVRACLRHHRRCARPGPAQPARGSGRRARTRRGPRPGVARRHRPRLGGAGPPPPAVGPDPLRPASRFRPGRAASREPVVRHPRQAEPARRLSPPRRALRRADPDPLARRWVPNGPQELLRSGPPPGVRPARLDMHQRQLPTAPRALHRLRGRHQEGDRLGARARPRVRRRSDLHLPRGKLRRRPPRRHRGADGQRRHLPAWIPRCRHVRRRRDRAVRLHGRIEPGPLPSSPADCVHADAPPLLLAHGDQDTLVPPEHARKLVDRSAPPRPTRSSTSSSPAASTPSTCSTPSASRRSSTASRRSPAGSRSPHTEAPQPGASVELQQPRSPGPSSSFRARRP